MALPIRRCRQNDNEDVMQRCPTIHFARLVKHLHAAKNEKMTAACRLLPLNVSAINAHGCWANENSVGVATTGYNPATPCLAMTVQRTLQYFLGTSYVTMHALLSPTLRRPTTAKIGLKFPYSKITYFQL